MNDALQIFAVVVALEVLRWAAGPTVAYVAAAILFAFCVGALWGAGDMKRRLQAMKDQIEELKP